MSQRRLNQGNRSSAVERMRCVGVTEPMGRDGEIDARAYRGRPNDSQNCNRLEEAAVLCGLARAEHGVIRSRVLGPDTIDEFPDRGGELDRSGNASFSEYRDLA